MKVERLDLGIVQLEILEMMACGYGGEDIAREMGLTYLEMGRERKRMYKAMGVTNGFHAIGVMCVLSEDFRLGVDRRNRKMNKYKIEWFDNKTHMKRTFIYWARTVSSALDMLNGDSVSPCTVYQKLGGKGDWVLAERKKS